MSRITPPKQPVQTLALDALVRRIELELWADDQMAGHQPPEDGDGVQSALNNFSMRGSGNSHIMATAK